MEIDQVCTRVEKFFNVADSIPLVAIVSSPFRIAVAKVQMMAAIILGLFSFLGQMIQSKEKKWEHLTTKCFEHFIHSVLNVLRGVGEILLSALIIGSGALFLYQFTSKNKFEPIIKYQTDSEPITSS